MIVVRTARRSDAAALVAHLRALVAEPGVNVPLAPDEVLLTIADERDLIDEFAGSSRSRLLVAVIDDAVVGELTLKPISDHRALRHGAVLGMSVAREWRRRGVGRALLAEAIVWARGAEFTRLELYVYARNTAAIRLYEEHGFELEGRRRRFIREGDTYLDDLVMARLL